MLHTMAAALCIAVASASSPADMMSSLAPADFPAARGKNTTQKEAFPAGRMPDTLLRHAPGGVKVLSDLPKRQPQDSKAVKAVTATSPADSVTRGSAFGNINPGSEIIFAVSTGKEHHEDRARTVMSSWCSALAACIYFSDAQNPSGNPPTVSINFDGLPNLGVYELAQLRYVPILDYMRELVISNHEGFFSNVKWVVLCDDDTYTFYHNLWYAVAGLDHTTNIYTGDVIPDEWLPVSQDGSGKYIGVSSNTIFINGGAGSIFSKAGIVAMNTAQCVNNSMPGNVWWKWQSDWMIGACAANAGMKVTYHPKGRFNQFVCADSDVQFCEDIHVSEYEQPCTLHPIRIPSSMYLLWNTYPNSTTEFVRNVRIRRVSRSTGQPDMSAKARAVFEII
jgi:hypothetical protein